MTLRNCFNNLQILLLVIALSQAISEYNIENNNPVIVQLDPYVSILDCKSSSRYNIPDILKFVTKLATKYTNVFVQLSEEDISNGSSSSLSLVPIAISKYNNENKPIVPLKLWLGIDTSPNTRNDISTPTKVLTKFLSSAKYVNEIYRGTVVTLLVPQHYVFPVNKTVEMLNGLYKIGILLDSKITSCTTLNKEVTEFVTLKTQSIVFVFSGLKLPTKLDKNEIPSFFQNFVQDCQKFEIPPANLGFLVSIPDTDENGKVNMFHMVSARTILENWFEDVKGPSVIISKAFDTPCKSNVEKRTDGLWRLKEDFLYNRTTEYKFEDKVLIAKTFDMQETFINKSWLQSKITMNRNYAGVLFSTFDQKRSYREPYPETDFESILNPIANRFRKIIVPIEDFSRQRIQPLFFSLRVMEKIMDRVEVTIMLLPHISIPKQTHTILNLPIEDIQSSQLKHEVVSGFVVPFNGNETKEFASLIKDGMLKNRNLSVTKFGYVFPISICSLGHDDESVRETLKDVDARVFYFYFEEDEESVKLGANRLFQQRVVIFEQCRNFIRNYDVTREKLGFVMFHYASSFEFYQSALSIQNFVRYWELLTNWAGNTNTTVILNNVLDGSRTFKRVGKTIPEIGWWRYAKDSMDSENKIWFDKQEDAVRVAEEDERRQMELINSTKGLSTLEIVLIVVMPLLFCGVFLASSRYLIKRYYEETYLTKSEMDNFFLGNEHVDNDESENYAHKAPYDKDRFEIDKAKFTIDEGPPLGSGEYGRVCKGKVERDSEIFNVAVKMVNPEKLHKTTLNGMLSEIKVLAFLEKHENITELIGANTEDLKDGKVFIFLELCQLGSLESQLRKLRPQRDSNEELFYSDNPESVQGKYVNMTTMNEVILDQELSNDLCRWSKEICNGMTYLASKHVVHADLAARNVLLNLRKEAKLCDFGLSRKLYNYTNYVKKQQEPLPWKWMSPESLRLLQFNEKSDVWAFGITLWEIYSLGDSPYPGLSYNPNFPLLLEQGFRLNEPMFNEQNMYTIMKCCWSTDPLKRPTFSQLLEKFI